MIVAVKSFTMRGVRYGPPARPDLLRGQLAEVQGRLDAVEQAWAERQAVLNALGLQTQRTEQEAINYEGTKAELTSVVTRLTAAIAEAEQPVERLVPKAVWDSLPKYKQRNFLSARLVQQREGRKLQEA